nr:hypothetical protein [Tanacetum cinerariifolium]
MENPSDVQNHLVEIQADDHDLLVNSNNENDDMLGYESEKQATDERIELLQTQLDNERSECQQKRYIGQEIVHQDDRKRCTVKKLSNEMTETKGMLSQLMNQLAAQGVQLNLSSQLLVASNVTLMDINNIDTSAYEVDGTQSSVVVCDKDAKIQKKSNGLVTSKKVMETMVSNKTSPFDF